MPPSSKSTAKYSTATIDFEATALRNSDILPCEATLRSLSEKKDNLCRARQRFHKGEALPQSPPQAG